VVAGDRYELIVVGGGSGGMGAAITAGRLGIRRVLWVEKEATLGGTGVHALVNVWQPSYGRSALAREIAERLIARGAGAYASGCFDTPSGRPIYRLDPTVRYEQTLTRWGGDDHRITSPLFVYEPEAMSELLRQMALETGHVDVATGCTFGSAWRDESGTRVARLRLRTGDEDRFVSAPWYIDATGDLSLTMNVGGGVTCGREGRDAYGEPSAPLTGDNQKNGWTLCFHCAEGPDRVELPREHYGNDSDWAHIGQMPAGGFYVNMCFQIPGEMGWRLGHDQARELLLRNIAARWPRVQEAYGLKGYGITQIAPRLGVREGYRLRARTVLTEHDFRAGNYGEHHEDCIAWTDHAMDRHSEDGGVIEAENGPMGIPLRCLQPVGLDNLLVACRGAGFSSLAASAARLQRTMIEMGEGAARFVAL